jgi:hypothetical protein
MILYIFITEKSSVYVSLTLALLNATNSRMYTSLALKEATTLTHPHAQQ